MLLGTLRDHATTAPDRIAVDPVSTPPLTYGALAVAVEGLAERLITRHDAGRPVAMQTDHGITELLLELALLEASTPVLSLPSFFTTDQLRHAIETCGAQALYRSADPDSFAPCDAVPIALPTGTARITFTSGSSGTPKGVCLSAAHMMEVAAAVVDVVGQDHAGRHLALLPPGILLETVAGMFATLLAGGTYLCPPQAMVGMADPFRPDVPAMVRAITEWNVTSLIIVPEYLAGLVSHMEAQGTRLPTLTIVAVGGARTPRSLLDRARAVGLPVRQGYGLTECASVVSLEDADDAAPGSVGRPLSHMHASIAVDGEVMLDGPVCLGTVGALRDAGPFATGDIGRIDSQGRLWIEGRKSTMIVTSFGRNISPEWVEEALLAQPGIEQAMVHGDGRPMPEALLTPAFPDADLAAAVTAANALLPPYASIGAWREVAHFTPANGMLTGNGRLRRGAIAQAWLSGEPTFFLELEAATTRERLRFLQIRQIQAGLKGTIDRNGYLAYLAQAYHHVRHTVPLLQAARAGLAHRSDLAAALDEYVAEETGHEEWILSDIAMAGGDAEAVRHSAPAEPTRAMVDHAYAQITAGNAIAFFGMVYVLESVSVALASRGASAVAQHLSLPPEAFTYLTSHGTLDQDHMRFFAQLVNGLSDPADRAAIVQMAKDIFSLYGAVFASVSLEAAHVPA
ncbi:AMP-binding protein [Sphingobium subterraneum]|uniref:Acyl-CoA synthetase (AMP-forming)/AMP-acid ligase II n=1 Tax=Sphingobium subterraneum TaxID=627688 RepID=A0A841J7X1_9SPHN|nr:AMP-binding protein [Sphingobium subterraneum]MBB6124625.1 acyl-CoA synthetase (AMP-forming)/AMP-acid ligase II [Sphingobium subterraneum]